MKTNRRGFFGALAGLAGGVCAAFRRDVPKEYLVSVEDLGDDWYCVNLTYKKGDRVLCEGNTLTVWGSRCPLS